MVPGIKVDSGTRPLAKSDKELITEGLDGLPARLEEYRARGARFAKWRAVFSIGGGAPSQMALAANAHSLARYAMHCQEADLVPIVEPEILMAGDHSIEDSLAATTAVLREVFSALRAFEIDLGGMILKPSMVTPGAARSQAEPREVAAATLECFLDCVPASLAGIALLSGGQSDQVAVANLEAINQHSALPWPVTFSFGRALQDAAMSAWSSSGLDRESTQRTLLERAEAASCAVQARRLVNAL